MPPKVTAIIPCMAAGDRPFIREAVQSVNAQTEPCETIVLVETANDWIEAALAELSGVRILRRPRTPAGLTRNAGVVEARTEFVTFLDADDVWMPAKTMRQLEFLQKRNEDFVGVDHLLMREDGTTFAYGTAKHIPMTSAWMVRRDYMLRFPFADSRNGDEDLIWWTDPRNSVTKHRIAEPLIRYRVRNISLSSAHASKRKKLRFAKLSERPLLRPLVMAGSYVVHHLNRRPYYMRPRTAS
jgi:glycosyltransferase involved in cell wall biosynthesis